MLEVKTCWRVWNSQDSRKGSGLGTMSGEDRRGEGIRNCGCHKNSPTMNHLVSGVVWLKKEGYVDQQFFLYRDITYP